MQKSIALAFFLLCLQLGNAQQVTLQVEDKPLSQVLSQLEKSYGLRFAYNPQQIKGKRVTFNFQDQNLDQLLDAILKPEGLLFDKVGDGYIAIHKAQSVFIKIRVYDQMGLENLPYATIRLKDSELGAITNTKGEAFLIIDNPIDAQLEFSFLGYEPVLMPIDATRTSQDVAVGLNPITTALGDVEVKEYLNRGIVSVDMASSFQIQPQEMEILPGLVERDPLLSAQIIAGVNSNGETAAGLNVRGSSPENTFIYWNDIPIYQSGHYFGTISNFIPASIGQIDIFKNFIPIEYGGASAGLVRMESRTAIDGRPSFEASLNMTHADFYGKLPFKGEQGVFMFSGRRSYNDLLSTPTFESFSEKLFKGNIVQDGAGGSTTSDALNSDLSFSDINLKWIYEPSSRTGYSFSFLRSANSLSASSRSALLNSSIDQNRNVESLGFNGSLEHRMNDKLSSRVSLSYSGYNLDYTYLNARDDEEEDDEDDDANDDQQSLLNKLKNVELRLTNSLQLSSDQVLKFGYQFNYLDVSNRLSISSFLEEDSEESNEASGFSQQLFGELNWNIAPNWQLILGSRFSHFSTLDQFKVSPQLRTNYRLSSSLVLKASFGIYDQYVRAVEETDATLSNAVEQHWLLANKGASTEQQSVPLTTNRQTVAGFIYEKNGWLLDVDLFHKDLTGLLARNLGFNVSSTTGFAQGTEILKGVDLTLRKRWKRYRAWLSYNFQDSEAQFTSLSNSTFPSSLNIKHQLSISNTLTTGSFEFSIGYSFKSGLPFSTVDGVTLVERTISSGDDDDDDDDEEEESETQEFYQLDYSNPNAFRLNNYHRVDFSAWYKFKGANRLRGEIGISFINVFDRLNTFNRSYSVDLNESNIAVPVQRDRFLLGFTPNFSIRINF